MYESIYRYALENGFSSKPHRVNRKIAGYFKLDENGLFQGIIAIDKKERDDTECPDIGSLIYGKESCNPICEKMECIMAGVYKNKKDSLDEFGNQTKHIGWMNIMHDGADHDETIKIIYRFLEDMEQDATLKQKVYEDCKNSKIKKTEYLSFIIDGLGKIEEITTWHSWFDTWMETHEKKEIKSSTKISCITGKPIEAISNANFPQIRTSQTGTGAYLMSYNKESFRTYGIRDNSGTPMSQKEADLIKSGIEHLLKSNNNHNDLFNILYWYDYSEKTDYKDYISMITSKEGLSEDFELTEKEKRKAYRAEKAFTEKTNQFISDNKSDSKYKNTKYHLMRFDVPSKGRFFVSNEYVASYNDLSNAIDQWINDSALQVFVSEEDKDSQTKYMGNYINSIRSLYKVLFNLVQKKEAIDIYSQIKKEFGTNIYGLLESMIMGKQIPKIYFSKSLDIVNRSMVANKDNAKTTLCLQIIKAFLLRSNSKEGKEMSEKLNKNATSPAYHLGRLLAIIERIQEKSNSKEKKLTVTIGNQYYKALKDNPKRVERLINKVQTAYIPKLRRENKQGDIIFFEKLLSEVQPKASGLYKKLKSEECGMFDLGYRQQKTDFYKTKKTEDADSINSVIE